MPMENKNLSGATLRPYLETILAGNRFDNDLATLSHFLSTKGSEAGKFYGSILERHGIDISCLPKADDYLSEFVRYKPVGNRFTFIDLFAGIGGFRMAFQNAGGNCVFTSEWDNSAQLTYSTNYGEFPFGDITKIEPSDIPDFDILAGGFPCQPFSTIGRREGFAHKTQGTMFFHIARIIDAKRPKAFLLENVPGLISHDDGKTLATITSVLTDELGYEVKTKVLNAADFGVPQERKRLYFVGFRKDLGISDFEFPENPHNRVGIGKFIERDAEGPSISERFQKEYLFKKDDGRPQIVDSSSDFPIKTLLATYYKIQRLTGTFVRGGKTGLRLFTEGECKAIQGFPRDFKVPVSRTQMYHQFGNAVAVPVVSAIASAITQSLFEHETQENRPFHKKMASLDGAISYLRMAMETYPGSRATIEEINEDIWKYRITVEKMQTDQTDRI